jgi:hypothetical protein
LRIRQEFAVAALVTGTFLLIARGSGVTVPLFEVKRVKWRSASTRLLITHGWFEFWIHLQSADPGRSMAEVRD